MAKVISCLGDSQTDVSPFYAVPAHQMWVEELAQKLREAGADVIGRSFGVSGQTTGECLNRVDVLQRWEVPTVAVLYAGVNDAAAAVPALTGSASGGTITTAGANTWIGVGFVITYDDGSIHAISPLSAVSVPAGSTGSITVGAVTFPTTWSSVEIYVTPTGYASSADAIASGNRVRLYSKDMTASGTTVTALPSGTAPMPTASTQANTSAVIKALKYGVVGAGAGRGSQNFVRGQADLPARARPGQRAVVLDDTSTTGGLAAVLSTQTARIAGDYSAAAAQAVWECRTPQAGESGWGRVAVAGTEAFADCCERVVVVSTNYLNWTSGGDTQATPYAANAAVRVQSSAAATADGAAYCDLYAFQSALIAGGETTQGSNSWHAITNNQHHNAYGHDTVARAVAETILAQSGWLRALT